MKEFTITIEEGKIKSLYREDVIDLSFLGPITKVQKVSDVVFDVGRQEWDAFDRKTGKKIATDRSRNRCIEKEQEYYELEIKAGNMPWD